MRPLLDIFARLTDKGRFNGCHGLRLHTVGAIARVRWPDVRERRQSCVKRRRCRTVMSHPSLPFYMI